MKWDACIASPATSAGAFIVTTKPALFYGISVSGSANNTFINVHNSPNTGGAKVFMIEAVATTVTNDSTMVPIVCGNGITATNIGTVTNYIIFYSVLKV